VGISKVSVLKWTAGITSRNLTPMARPFCKAFDLTWSPRGRNVWQQIQFSGVPATKKTLGPVPKSFSLRPFVRFSSFVFLERGRSEAQTLDLSPVNRRRLFGDWPVCLGLPGSRRGRAGRLLNVSPLLFFTKEADLTGKALDLSPVNRRRLLGDRPVCLGLPGSRRG
jgi:hypothetical protein